MAKSQNTKPTTLILSRADLPPAVRVFWDTAPDQFKVPAILAAIDCYCALGTRLRAMYVYDPLEPHALLLQLLVLGEPGSGKSFTRPIVKQLMRPLKLKDLEQKRIEQAYAELKKTASKNKPLPEEPITCTRNLQTITRAKLVKRADMFIRKYGEPLAFFFFNEELATMTESNKRAFADLNTMDRLAYDLGAEYGSDTLSDASYNADVDVIYCSLFCGTDNALNEYITKRAVEGGNCTRKIVTRIDEDVLGEDAPMFRQQTADERALVTRTIQQLMDETYTEDDLLQPVHNVEMEWINGAVRKWCQEQRQQVIKTGSRAHNCFYKRSSVSAWRMATLLYHLWCQSVGLDSSEQFGEVQKSSEQVGGVQKSSEQVGEVMNSSKGTVQNQSEPFRTTQNHSEPFRTTQNQSEQFRTIQNIRTKCIRFYRFMAQYILDGLLTQWGKQYDQMHKHDEDEETQKVSLYDQMPKQFSRDQLNEVCAKQGLSPGRTFLHKWRKAKLVYQPDPNVELYVKNY